jgi:hypothetical protein
MSDYWQAVNRAVLGVPGTAEPRPRSIFEPEDGEPSDLVARDEEAEVSTTRPEASGSDAGPERPRARDVVREELAAAAPRPPEPAKTESTASAQRETRVEMRQAEADRPQSAEPAAERTAATARVEAPAGDEARPAATHATEHHAPAERVAVTRETIIVESQRGDIAVPAESVMVAEPARHDTPAQVEPAEPPVVVAEPAAFAPASFEVAAMEPSPLVIEIGRIEIRIASEAPAQPAPRSRDSSAVLALGDYLAQRSKADR